MTALQNYQCKDYYVNISHAKSIFVLMKEHNLILMKET